MRHSGRTTLAFALSLAVLGSLVHGALADTALADSNPRIPPGRDPGGVPVAVIGPGIDYRKPEIAGRLARDGEGDLIGWDFTDNDARPFEPEAAWCPTEPCPSGSASPTAAPTRLLLGEAGASRIVVLRLHHGDRRGLATALQFASQSPARIVAVLAMDASGAAPDWPLLAEAAQRFPNLLLIVPSAGSDTRSATAEQSETANLLIVSAAIAKDHPAAEATATTPEAAAADLAVPLPVDAPAPDTPHLRARIAATRIAALAARLHAVAPELDARELKQRILSLATSPPPDVQASARGGWIAEPQRHHRLEK